MAATRVIASAGSAVSGVLLSRGQLAAKPQSLHLCFKNGRLLTQKRRLFTCNAIQNPQVQTKEEGQPETLDYRVFFLDNSGKKVWKNSCVAFSEWLTDDSSGGVFAFVFGFDWELEERVVESEVWFFFIFPFFGTILTVWIFYFMILYFLPIPANIALGLKNWRQNVWKWFKGSIFLM